MIEFAGQKMRNRLVAASCPITESLPRLKCCDAAGFGAAILKTSADYEAAPPSYGRRVVYIGDAYYADSPFQREILTMEKGISLFRVARASGFEMRLIPSVTAVSTNPAVWLDICRAFEREGAEVIQADFFYFGELCGDEAFYDELTALLNVLTNKLDAVIMPKLNPRFEAEKVCGALMQGGVRYVSLLDSMRRDPPTEYGLHSGTTSYFGPEQLPMTQRFLQTALRRGLRVCAGGGVSTPDDVCGLLTAGAELAQVASCVLKNGFSYVRNLLDEPLSNRNRAAEALNHHTWCDIEEGEPCTHCGGCRNC